MPDLIPVDHDPFTEAPRDLVPVAHDPFVLERIPPQMNVPAQQQWGAQKGVDLLGGLTGVSDAARAARGEMTEEEQRNFALMAMAGMIPGARAMKPAGAVIRSRPVRAAGEDLFEVADANFLHGKPVGNRTVPIDTLKGGASLSQPIEADRVNRIADEMAGPNGYVRRLITDDQGNVIEGQHRLEALRKLGIDQVPVSVIKDLSRGYDVDQMRAAIQRVGALHPDQVHGVVRRALETADEAGGPAKALEGYSMPAPFSGHFKAALEAMQPPPPGIRAYHGSPYDFEKFDLSKIGTGEGAQAYGHGLYFAESEGVAKSYKDAMRVTDMDWPVMSGGEQVGRVPAWVARGSQVSPTRADEILADFRNRAAEMERENHWNTQGIKDIVNMLEAAKAGKATFSKPGHMYEVGISADPDHFLHWDKPLSEQSEYVKNAMNPDFLAVNGHKTMQQAYPYGVNEATAKSLRDAGIPGIRYLDQGSRGAGEGTSNFVVFDDKLISIIKKYGIAGLIAGGGAHFATTPVDHDPFKQ